jgi:dihydrolipoamide dehydrogenase
MADYDVIVIGGGPGGYLAAERLGHAKKKVLLAEEQYLGGTCLNVGCIPTKSLLNSAKLYAHAKESEQFGVTASGVAFDWDRVQAWKAEVVQTLVAGVGQTEKRAGVEVVSAHATLIGPGVVEVDGQRKTAEHVIVATGSVPAMPPIPGAKDNPAVLDSTGLLALDRVPGKLAVIGGGVIGVEFASLFAAFGAEVEIIEMLPEIVPFMDDDIAARLRKGLKKVKFSLGSKVEAIEGSTVVYTDAQGKQQRSEADVVLMAVGRRPLVEGWGAREAGLEYSPKGVVVTDEQRTNLPNVWAVGDVTGRSLLAHAAYRMAEVAVAHILDPVAARASGQVLRTETIPWAVYSMPEAAGVGLTEAGAKAAGLEVVTATVPLVLSGRFIAENGLKAPGAVKIVAEKGSRVLRGVHMLGPYAPETIWGAAAALEMELTVDDLRQVVFPHPTVSEGIREAAWAVSDK